MTPLPKFRVNFTLPFSLTGMDFMGPLSVRNLFYNKDEILYKVFIVVYTWASSTAIRLDIVPDASCSSFICNLRQFISVNDMPDLYISECFTGWELKDSVYIINQLGLYIRSFPMVGRVLGMNGSCCSEKSGNNPEEISIC